MRYYLIQLTEADGSQSKLGDGTPAMWTSKLANGRSDPGALQVEFDLPVTTLASPASAAADIKIWGVPLAAIGQASNLNGKFIKVYAGFAPGLPLATSAAAQAGLILQGQVWQAFGNWIGVNQYLEFLVVTSGGDLVKPQNVTFNCPANMTLSDAISSTLAVAAPGYKVDVAISPDLKLPRAEAAVHRNLTQFSQYVKRLSTSILNANGSGTYTGVDILVGQNMITVRDGSTQSAPKQIAFTDLVGQPTWIDPGTIQVVMTMRADLQPTDYVTLPPTQVTVTAASAVSVFRNSSVFQGSFLIAGLRHVGNFRSPDAAGWVSVADCVPQSAPAA